MRPLPRLHQCAPEPAKRAFRYSGCRAGRSGRARRPSTRRPPWKDLAQAATWKALPARVEHPGRRGRGRSHSRNARRQAGEARCRAVVVGCPKRGSEPTSMAKCRNQLVICQWPVEAATLKMPSQAKVTAANGARTIPISTCFQRTTISQPRVPACPQAWKAAAPAASRRRPGRPRPRRAA